MLFLPVAACLFLATVEILLAGAIVMFLQWISIGRGCTRQKPRPGASPALAFRVLEVPLTNRSNQHLEEPETASVPEISPDRTALMMCS
jgi:hypothetical protein